MSLALARLAGVVARIGKARNLAEVAEIEGMDQGLRQPDSEPHHLGARHVAAILDESLLDYVTLFDMASGTPLLWDEQRNLIEEKPRLHTDLSNRP